MTNILTSCPSRNSIKSVRLSNRRPITLAARITSSAVASSAKTALITGEVSAINKPERMAAPWLRNCCAVSEAS